MTPVLWFIRSLRSKNPVPKVPCTSVVCTWALKGFLYPYFGVYVCNIIMLGPFGLRNIPGWAIRQSRDPNSPLFRS